MKILHIIIISILFLFNIHCFAQSLEKSGRKSENLYDTILLTSGKGEFRFELLFKKGSEYNHPVFVAWFESTDGSYLGTIFVTKSFGTGIYGHADARDGKWDNLPGESIRKAALPYWSYKRNIISRDSLYIPTPENPVADAITGATPKNNFIIISDLENQLPDKFVVLFELNQPFDYNNIWTNSKFGKNSDYITSGQPSLVYAVVVDTKNPVQNYFLNPIGHGSPNGKDGLLYTDLSSLTSAKMISKQIQFSIQY